MSKLKSDFLATLDARGFIHQGTDLEGLDALAVKGPITAYIGFDCTAKSFHVGSLVQVMLLRWLQQTGLDCVIFGPGTIEVAHKPNEWMPKDDFARASGYLDERPSRPEKTFLVRIQDGHQGNLGQVETLPEQVDAHHDIENAAAQVAQDLGPFQCLDVRMEVAYLEIQ